MPFKFNPFSGNFDQTGSGGGGSSYIDGEVQNFSALPETLGSPAVDSAYLVREAEGTWLLNRKPAGIYIRTANTGTRASDWTYAGEFPDVFNDANFVLYDNGDSTKNLQFQLSGIDTATTRTLTAPNASGTIARTEDFAAPPAIGNTTPNSGAFTTLSANNGTITANEPVLDLAQTWNDGTVAFTGLRFNVTNTASAAASSLIDLQVGGTSLLRVDRSGLIVMTSTAGIRQSSTSNPVLLGGIGNFNSAGLSVYSASVRTNRDSHFGWTPDTNHLTAADLQLHRDAADTLAQRRSTNAQTFNIYNTFTNASNHERGFMRWSSNVLQIGTEAAGTGSVRNVQITVNGTNACTFSAVGSGVSVTARDFIAGSTISVSNAILSGTANNLLLLNGTNAQAFRIYNTASGTNNVNFDRVNFRWASNEFIIDAEAGGTGTLRGIKIGSATSSLLGFYGATPVDQPATVADPAGGGTIDTEARNAIGEVIDRLQELGLIAT